MTGFYFGADTSREYCQGNHDQRNAGIVYSIKSKRIIIMNMIIHQSVYILVMYDGFICETTAIDRNIFCEGRHFRKCNCTSACLASVGDANSFTYKARKLANPPLDT